MLLNLQTMACAPLPETRRWFAAWSGGRLIALLAAGLTLAFLPGAWAQSKPVGEYELKAAFVSKFPLFVRWPDWSGADTNRPIVIGVLGKTTLNAPLEAALRGKVVDGRALEMKVCASVTEAAACQIVFIADSEKADLEKILAQLVKNVLTVSDLPGFAERGGMLGLSEANRKVRLEINLESVQTSGLRVDPQLLQLAKVVRGAASKGNP